MCVKIHDIPILFGLQHQGRLETILVLLGRW